MSGQLKPMRWPMPVPMLWWRGDYADIRERVQRTGRLDTDEVWEPHSDDSWEAFRRAHGSVYFDADWREIDRLERERQARDKRNSEQRTAAYVREQQARWEADRRAQQQAKQARADEEWRAHEEPRIAVARGYWTHKDPAYATQAYHAVTIRRTAQVYGVTFLAGHTYWVPTAVMFGIKGHGGL